MRISLSFVVCLLLASCNIYHSDFECPPGEGVGCASVGEVMEMIVETEEGEDLFLKYRGRPLFAENKRKSKGGGEQRLLVSRTEKGQLVLIPEPEGEKR